MKRVYASDVLAEVKHYQNLLDEARLRSAQRSPAGEVPFLPSFGSRTTRKRAPRR